MDNLRGYAWRSERFGIDGQPLLDAIAPMLLACHTDLADAQKRSRLKSHAVYGQIWQSVHAAMALWVEQFPTSQLFKPRGAPYNIPVVNGTAVFPWRFAKDGLTDIEDASFGPYVSPTRQSILNGVAVPAMLPFESASAVAVAEQVEEEVELYREEFRAVAAEHPVVVVAYASNPAALHVAYWGDVTRLRTDGTIDWGYREQIDLTRTTPPGRHLRVIEDGERPSFDSASLTTPTLIPRRSTKEAASDAAGPNRGA